MLNFVDVSHIQQLLASLPAALVLVDEDDKVCWVNDSALQWSGSEEADWLGKSRSELAEPQQGLVSEGAVHLGEARTKDLACIVVPMGQHRLYYCSDVSQMVQLKDERDQLRQKVAELDPRDSVTGLLNRRALFQNLEQQASRSRRYGNMLAVMILRLANLADYRQQYGAANADELLLGVTHMLNDQMRWADLIGRVDDNEFLIVMPETDESMAREIRGKINDGLTRLSLPGGDQAGFPLHLEFGVAQWRKGDDVGLLMQRARESLEGGAGARVAV